jgi:threonine synthase
VEYISTRGGVAPAAFDDVLLAGLAPDGGLYIPKAWPRFTEDEIAGFADLSYAQVAARVLGKFAGNVLTPAECLEICEGAYATFDHPAATPLVQMDANRWLMELYRGPTLAFKDVAMQMLARLYDKVLGERGQTMTIVAATSGDTGGAAVEAFRGSKHVKLVILFPDGRISPVQRRFMTTPPETNIECLSVAGDFDDCQKIVKGLFLDDAFRTDVALSGVNSINWARIAAQSVYYFVAACALGGPSRKARFVVPSGNFGDAFAGYVAMQLGLPVDGIVLATNSNDILARAVTTGRYARGEAVATQSPAMDIQVASNFERLVFEASGRDGALTASLFEEFAKTGTVDLPTQVVDVMRQTFTGAAVSEPETAATIAKVWTEARFLVDPHTAVGLTAAARLPSEGAPIVTLATASPAKFPESILEILPGVDASHPKAEALAGLPERMTPITADAEAVKAFIRDFARKAG